MQICKPKSYGKTITKVLVLKKIMLMKSLDFEFIAMFIIKYQSFSDLYIIVHCYRGMVLAEEENKILQMRRIENITQNNIVSQTQ